MDQVGCWISSLSETRGKYLSRRHLVRENCVPTTILGNCNGFVMFRRLISPVRALLQSPAFGNAVQSAVGSSKTPQTSAVSLVPVSSAFHTTSTAHLGRKQRKQGAGSFETKEAPLEGENASLHDVRKSREEDVFPDLHLPTRLFNGTMFRDIPILHVKATKNNTLMTVSDSNGLPYLLRSCGYDGFKNARKGTNVAAQATGFVLGKKMMQRGLRTVRVKVNGLGPGRLSSLRGVTIAGVEIISITDSTRVSWNPPRPRKQRRI